MNHLGKMIVLMLGVGFAFAAGVRAEAPAPVDDAGVAPGLVEDFDYESIEAFLHQNRVNWPHPHLVVNVDRMAIDREITPPGYNAALRYDFPDVSGRGGEGREGRCSTYTISRDFYFSGLEGWEDQKEIWLEVWYRFSENWTTLPPADWNCTGNPDYKMVFGLVSWMEGADRSVPQGRFGILHGNSPNGSWWLAAPYIGQGTPPPAVRVPGAAQEWDGQWRRMRGHFRVSSALNEPDGRMRVWTDDRLLWDSGGVVVNRGDIRGVSLGRNRNHGAGEEMSLWFGGMRLWNIDPGW